MGSWQDLPKIPQIRFQLFPIFHKKHEKAFFWKWACFFEKKRAPARNARNRDEERVFFLKKRTPARQTPGLVAELVFRKNRQICGYNRSIWHFTPPTLMPPTRSTQWNPQNSFFNWKIFVFIGNGSKTNQKPIFNSHSPKNLRPKILPPNCLTHYLSPYSISPSRKIDSKGICQKIIIISLFPLPSCAGGGSALWSGQPFFLKNLAGRLASQGCETIETIQVAKPSKPSRYWYWILDIGYWILGFYQNPHFYNKFVFPTLSFRKF